MNPASHSPRPSGGSRLWWLAAIALTAAAAAGCDPDDDADRTTTGCAEAVEVAAWAQEVGEQVALLDDALVICRSYSTLEAELARHRGIIGYDTRTFVSLRCTRTDDDALRDSPSCAAVLDPTTTVPATTVYIPVFVGDTLDGRTIELRPGPDVRFVGDVPAVVQQTVDIAFESGCEGVLDQRDLWAGRIDDSDDGDEASLYAQHAQNVADYIGCDSEPIDLDALDRS